MPSVPPGVPAEDMIFIGGADNDITTMQGGVGWPDEALNDPLNDLSRVSQAIDNPWKELPEVV